MRIALNSAFLPSQAAGVRTYTRALVEYLVGQGDEIYLYAPEPVALDGQGQITWRQSPQRLRGGKLGSLLRVAVWYQTVLPRHVERDQIQVLLSTMQEGTILPVCPQVVVVHDLIPLLFRDANPLWRQYYQYILPRVLRACAHVIAVSEHTKRDIIRCYGLAAEKIAVVYNWVNPLFFSEDSGTAPEGCDGQPYFLYVGKTAAYKNLETVLRAFAVVCGEVSQKLVCVVSTSCRGDHDYLARMLELAGRLGIRERLVFYSGLSHDQILFLYRHATALLLLSRYEGFGYPPLEAMAVGTPAIVSDSGALAEVSGPGAVRVAATDAASAAEAMRRLATRSEYRASLTKVGMARAREFSVEVSGRKIRDILTECAVPATAARGGHTDGRLAAHRHYSDCPGGGKGAADV